MFLTLCVVLYPLLFRPFPLLCPASSIPLLPSLCPAIVFFLFCLFVVWHFMWVPPMGFHSILPSGSECTVDLLCAHFATYRLLPVFSCFPPQCAFNATFPVYFWPARDRLALDCRHPYSLLSLFFLWLCFFDFACICLFFFIAIFLYIFFYLFLLFGCFFIFVVLFHYTFFLSCFLL